MAKKKVEETKEKEAKKEVKDTIRKISLESFLEESPKTKSSISGHAFKVWFVHVKKNSPFSRMTVEEWEKTLNKFLNEEVK